MTHLKMTAAVCENLAKRINRTYGQTSALFNVEAVDMDSCCCALNGFDGYYENGRDLQKKKKPG